MAATPDVDDLTLVQAIARTGSIGAAARAMLVSQPSASARLARLERRLGVALFQRGTRGATPTPAGKVLCQRAEHILGHLDHVVDEVRAAGVETPIRVGCFHGLADSVLPLLDAHHRTGPLVQYVDHGATLIEWVAEGTLDAAVVSIAEQLALPVNVVAQGIGRDEMVVLVPDGAPAPRKGRLPLKELTLPTSTYDLRFDELAHRIIALGGTPRFGATVTATVRMARLSHDPAVVPRSAALLERQPGERIVELPFRWDLRLSLVSRPDPAPELRALAGTLTRELGLARISRPRRTDGAG